MRKEEEKVKILNQLREQLRKKLEDVELTLEEKVYFKDSLSILDALFLTEQETIFNNKLVANIQKTASFLDVDPNLSGVISTERKNYNAKQLFLTIQEALREKSVRTKKIRDYKPQDLERNSSFIGEGSEESKKRNYLGNANTNINIYTEGDNNKTLVQKTKRKIVNKNLF